MLPLLRQPLLVIAQQRRDARQHALRLVSQQRLRPVAQLGQPVAGDVAVVGVAEDFLHLFDRRVQFLLEGRLEAVGEHLHRVAQPFADDAHLMQVARNRAGRARRRRPAPGADRRASAVPGRSAPAPRRRRGVDARRPRSPRGGGRRRRDAAGRRRQGGPGPPGGCDRA